MNLRHRTGPRRLPSGRRGEVIATLTHVMADAEAFRAYVAVLEGERRRRGREVERQLLGMGGLDIPDAHIAVQGFGGLSEDELADIALSPNARRLREYLDDPETACGDWLIDQIIEVELRGRPRRNRRRAEQIYQSLRNAGLLATDPPDPISITRQKEERRPTLRPQRPLWPGPACRWPQASSSACSSAAWSSAAEAGGLRLGAWRCSWLA